MFHNVIFLPHELYYGPFQWAPSTPPREESLRRVFSSLSSSPEDSPRSFFDLSEGEPESFAANSSLSEPLCDVFEAFRLFWDRELQMIDSSSQSPLDMILVDSVMVQKMLLLMKVASDSL